MRLLVYYDLIASLSIEKRNLATLMSGNQQGCLVRKRDNRGLAADRVEHADRFVVLLCTVTRAIEFKNTNSTLITHALLGDTDEARAVLREGDTLDGCGELPCKQAFASLHVPQLHRIVGRARYEEARLN